MKAVILGSAKLQHRIIRMLRAFGIRNRTPLRILSKDSCSEVARLAGCWILDSSPKTSAFIAQGVGVSGDRNLKHDLLVVQSFNHGYRVIDPTVWQKFPLKRNIEMGATPSLKEVFAFLHEKYGGRWHISEEIKTKNYPSVERTKLTGMIRDNVREVERRWFATY
ncbi:MAG: hypothetical protein WCJ29_03385 [bacterium]